MASGTRAERCWTWRTLPMALALVVGSAPGVAAGQVATPAPPAAGAPLPVTAAPVAPPLAAAPPTPAPVVAATPGTFLAMSDVHYVGTPGEKCYQAGDETDAALWAAAQAEAKQVIQDEKPAFALYLGDLPSHCDPRPDSQFTSALDGLASIVGTGTKLIYVPGNNDSLAGDYQAFTAQGGTPLGQSAAWGGKPVLNAQPGDMIDDSNLATGYYSVYALQATATAAALRVIALNTTIFTSNYDQRVWTYQADSDGQLSWLNGQLKQARAKGEKVIIAMHVPPGTDGYGGGSGTGVTTMWNGALTYQGSDPDLKVGSWVQRVFLELVAGYRPEIVGLLSSHTHYNEIRRLRDCTQPWPTLGDFTELDVAIPSITTDHGNNPSVKIISYDSGFEWTENRTYFAPAKSGAGWATNAPLSFDLRNYPCPSCMAGDTLYARIAALDTATTIGTSSKLTNMMIRWLKVGAGRPGPRMYALSLDAVCEVPPTGAGG
ncbi:metallophosphoesterase [Sphingomonas sp. RT2P30]